MNDDWTVVGTVTDGSGKLIEIAHAEGKVRIAVKAPVACITLTSIVLDTPQRDEFDRHYVEAAWQAEVSEVKAAKSAEAERQAEAHEAVSGG